MNKINAVRVKCNDECGIIEFKKEFDDKYDIVYISYFVNAFYANQHDLFYIWKTRLKMIWDILRGKEYMLFDTITLSKEEQENFKFQMQEFLNDL